MEWHRKMEKIKKHLQDSQVTYFLHLRFAVYASLLLMIASIASLIHALVPNLFPSTAAKIVIKLYNQRLKEHPNPQYRKILDE